MRCRNCGEPVDPQRVELGYDYCLKEECQRRCLKPVRLASIGVNKAADYYTAADELVPPPLTRSTGTHDEPDDGAAAAPEPIAPDHRPQPALARPKTTLERLRNEEAVLDAALEDRYERFRRGEITAVELDQQRDELIRRFNEVVRAENIRYRGMLRKRPIVTSGRNRRRGPP